MKIIKQAMAGTLESARPVRVVEADVLDSMNETDGLVLQPSNTQKVDFVCVRQKRPHRFRLTGHIEECFRLLRAPGWREEEQGTSQDKK